MRGRTNIGGGGIAINAVPQQKTIKGGNIIAGDFVEYYSEPAYIEQTQGVNFVFAIGDYDIAQIGDNRNMLAAFKDGEQKFTYAGYDCRYVGKYNNFILFVDKSSRVLGVLSIDTNGFTLLSSVATGNIQDYTYYAGIWGGNGKVCFFTSLYNSSSTYYGILGIANISENGILSNYVLTQTQVNVGSGYSEPKYVTFYNGNFYALSRNNNNSSYILPISIDNENNGSLGTAIYSYLGKREVFRKNDVIVFTVTESSQGRLYIVNFVTGNYIYKTIPNSGELVTNIKDSLFLATSKVQMKPAWSSSTLVGVPNELRLYSFNEQTYEITKLDSIIIDEDYSPSTVQTGDNYYDVFIDEINRNYGTCDLDLAYAQCKKVKKVTKSGSSQSYSEIPDLNLYLYSIENNRLQDPTQKQYVKPYLDGGNPIGVAKDSGVVNDVIDVYIPVASS